MVEAKARYRAGGRRVYGPWIPEPGVWAQWDWGDGPLIRVRRTLVRPREARHLTPLRRGARTPSIVEVRIRKTGCCLPPHAARDPQRQASPSVLGGLVCLQPKFGPIGLVCRPPRGYRVSVPRVDYVSPFLEAVRSPADLAAEDSERKVLDGVNRLLEALSAAKGEWVPITVLTSISSFPDEVVRSVGEYGEQQHILKARRDLTGSVDALALSGEFLAG